MHMYLGILGFKYCGLAFRLAHFVLIGTFFSPCAHDLGKRFWPQSSLDMILEYMQLICSTLSMLHAIGE